MAETKLEKYYRLKSEAEKSIALPTIEGLTVMLGEKGGIIVTSTDEKQAITRAEFNKRTADGPVMRDFTFTDEQIDALVAWRADVKKEATT